MNNYFLNQAKRADELWMVKVIGLVVLAIVPGKADKVWNEHCDRMQRRLDNQRGMGYGVRYIDGATVKR